MTMSMSTEFFDFFKHEPQVKWAKASHLIEPVDNGGVLYQRSLPRTLKDGTRAKRNAALTARFRKYLEGTERGHEFMPERWSMPLVNKRPDGTLALMDGNGRCHFAVKYKGADYVVPYLEYDGLSLYEEMQIFTAQRYAKSVGSSEFYNAELEGGEESTVAMKATVEAHGFELGTKRNQISVGAARTLLADETLAATLGVLQKVKVAFPNDTRLTHAGFILGISEAVKRADLMHKDILVAYVLEVVSPETITADMPNGSNQASKYVFQKLKEYHTKLYIERGAPSA